MLVAAVFVSRVRFFRSSLVFAKQAYLIEAAAAAVAASVLATLVVLRIKIIMLITHDTFAAFSSSSTAYFLNFF